MQLREKGKIVLMLQTTDMLKFTAILEFVRL